MWTPLTITTRKPQEFVDITPELARLVARSGVQEGVCRVFVPHTTAGVTLNENCDPDVAADLLATLERLIPVRGPYRHQEGNSHAHLKASLMGAGTAVPVIGGRLALGSWQGVFLAEFDGPRPRTVQVAVTPG